MADGQNTISVDDVRYIAALGRLALSDAEVQRLAGDLGGILHYIEKLQELDVRDVPPTSHVLSLQNVYRPDDVKPSLPQAEALSVAVAQHNGSFKVPQVIE